MAGIFKIKQGDLRPYLKVQLVNLTEEGEVEGPQDLTGATIVFTMKNKAADADPVLVIDEAVADIVGDPVEGWVQYEWEPGDTDIAGSFLGEFEASYSGEPLTFPNGKLGFDIKITPELS